MGSVMTPELRARIRERVLKTLAHAPKGTSELFMCLGHSRTSIVEVMRELEAEGLVWREGAQLPQPSTMFGKAARRYHLSQP